MQYVRTQPQFEVIDTIDNCYIGGPYRYRETAERLALELNEHYGESDRFVVVKRKSPMPLVFVDVSRGIANANTN